MKDGRITIEDASGKYYDFSITGKGNYEFTIKIDGQEYKKFTVNIDQYEIIYANGEIKNENYDGDYISRIVAYDFDNQKILKVDSGEYGKEPSTLETIPSEKIETIQDIGSFINPYGGTNYYKLKSDNITITGYYRQYDIM